MYHAVLATIVALYIALTFFAFPLLEVHYEVELKDR